MEIPAALAGLLACPTCGTALAGASCLSCRVDYPAIGGIPWLMPEPRLALAEWRGRLHHLLSHYAEESRRQRAALGRAAGASRTRQRIEHVADALDDQARRIRALMQPLGIERRSEAHAVHVALGLTILVVTLARLVWRRLTPLPPWAPGLSAGERRLAHGTELALYASLLVMPATGIVLLLSDDDLLWLHVASHVVFFAALALHVGLVLKHQLVDRDRLLDRML